MGSIHSAQLSSVCDSITLLNYNLFVTVPNVHEEVYRKIRTGIDLEQSPECLRVCVRVNPPVNVHVSISVGLLARECVHVRVMCVLRIENIYEQRIYTCVRMH